MQVELRENKYNALEKSVVALKNIIVALEQSKPESNQVIASIPEKSTENFQDILTKLLKCMAVVVKKRDILETYRINKVEEAPIVVSLKKKFINYGKAKKTSYL